MRALALALLVLLALPAVAVAQPAGLPPGPAADGASRAAAEGRLVRALTEHFLGNDSAAVQLLDATLALRPGDAATLDALAEVYAAMGRPTDALYHAGLAAEAAPAEASVHVRLGELRAGTGQRDAAVAAFETARRLSPTSTEPLVALADLHAAAGRAEAEREALEALVALGETPAAWLRLAVLYDAAGDNDRAVRALRAAVRLAPNEPALRARLAAATGAPAADPPPGPAGAPADASADASVDDLLAVVAADPRRLDAWAAVLDRLARAADPRAGDTADEATLLFPTVPAVLTPAAEAYLAASRPADAARAARAGLAALDGAAAPEGDPAATAALRARLGRALAAAAP